MTIERKSGFEGEDTPREECGVFAVIRLDGEPESTIGDRAYRGILGLQHRGEEGSGISIYNGKMRPRFRTIKGKGLIASVFGGGAYLDGIRDGSLALAHTRYSTAGKSGDAASRAHPHGSKVHSYMLMENGNGAGLKHPDNMTDTEWKVELLDERMTETGQDLKPALLWLLGNLTGGYALIASDGDRLFAARDPWGLRPLVQANNGTHHYFSSEDSALRIPSLNVMPNMISEVPPGKMITIQPGKEPVYDDIYLEMPIPLDETALCAMEHAYFSRPDSNLAGRNVQKARYDIGRYLAEQENESFEADIVVGVPDSGIDSAMGYADALTIPHVRAIHKNAYIGRTFIQENQQARTDAAWLKFRINPDLIDGKRVVVVDDSIVRGTNSRVIVEMLRQAGAAAVHMRAGFPEHRYPCLYGIDTGDPKELIANRMDVSHMIDYLNVDSLGFITTDNLRRAISPKIGGLCMACVTGDYPTAGRTIGLPMPKIK